MNSNELTVVPAEIEPLIITMRDKRVILDSHLASLYGTSTNVLNSPSAVEISVFIVRAFVRLRESLVLHKEVLQKIDALEKNAIASLKSCSILSVSSWLRLYIHVKELDSKQ